MSDHASKPPLRLVAVAADVDRARSLADNVAAAFRPIAPPRLVGSIAEALTLLRREPCDALVALHEPPTLDAITLARALRGAGDETPLAILGHEPSIDLEATVWDAGADEYACLAETTAGQLAGRLRRSIDARERLRESRRLLVSEQQRLASEQEQNEWLVREQHRLIDSLRGLPTAVPSAPTTLRLASDGSSAEAAYTAMVGSAIVSDTSTGGDLGRLADQLASESITGPRLLELHLSAVEQVAQGLASKSQRVVRGQADRLLVEAFVHLAEAYRRRYLEIAQPTTAEPSQDVPAARAA